MAEAAHPRSPYSADETHAILDRFYRDGFVPIPGVLSREECDAFRRRTDELTEDPVIGRSNASASYSFVLSNPLEHDRAFAEIFLREPILSLMRALLGPECRFCGQSVIRNKPGEAVSFWHVDDCNKLEYPLPEGVERWDPRVRLPITWLTTQCALTDILVPDDGPTEIVPGSHYSGRQVPKSESPTFEGRGPVPVLCKAGDIYLFNHQLWHRGSVNHSDRRRYLMQNQYCRAWGPYRFNSSDATVRLPDEEMAGAPESLVKLLDNTRRTSA